MGKRTMKKVPSFLSKITDPSPSSSSWPWPAYCHQPRTLSFRTGDSNIFNTLNSGNATTPAKSPIVDSAGDPAAELVIRGLRSDRLYFKPGETSSILEEAKIRGLKKENEFNSVIKDSVIMSMDSEDPYADFKKSMEEMVDAHGFKDWESLEQLLSCYLKLNANNNHGFIIAAFVDLLVSLAFNSGTTSTTCCSSRLSPSSPLSFYTSSNFSDDSSSTPCISSLEEVADDDEIKHN